jgi:phospholipase C
VDAATASPIQHIVIIEQENHSFDNVLGALCTTRVTRCDGVTNAKIGRRTVKLSKATDIVPYVGHAAWDQNAAINGGRMNRFDKVKDCGAPAYRCYSQFQPSQIPNVARLARAFTVADHTFSQGPFASSMQHFTLLSGGTTDGFVPDLLSGPPTGPGWGCDSGYRNLWRDANGVASLQPLCVPAPQGSTAATLEPVAVQHSAVPWVPTILDRLEAKGLSWRMYTASTKDRDYAWATCPFFADCLYDTQQPGMVPSAEILTDASAGALPSFSVLLPAGGVTGDTSQHNRTSMKVGDNWIGRVVSALEHGPDWSSTAIFLTYDDCGCFYDHVPPPAGLGIRVPMIIISPYARHGATDRHVASLSSVIAYTEHTFGLPALSAIDANAYDFSGAFNYAQKPQKPVPMVSSRIPAQSTEFLATHKANLADPT